MFHRMADRMWRNPALMLALIRDGKLRCAEDLQKLGYDTHYGPLNLQLEMALRNRIDELISAGFVKETDGEYNPTEIVHKLRSVLDISLDELSQKMPGGLWANPIFRFQDIKGRACDVFVLMPFLDDLRPVYEDHVKKIGDNLGLTVARADDIFTTHSVIDDIWTCIYRSKVVIADCTGRNPNVFYEMAIAHTIGRDVILLSQDVDDVPFDVQHRRCILYQLTPRGMAKFEAELAKTLEPWSNQNAEHALTG